MCVTFVVLKETDRKEHQNKNKNANKKKTNVKKQTLGLGHYKAIQGQRRH